MERQYTEKQKDAFRQRLKKIIGSKITTTMIFALAQFELAFGDVFGYGKNDEDLTPDEQMNRAKWEEVRNNILNTGNQQRRNANAELDMHEVIWKRYETVFYTKPLGNVEDNKE